MNIFWRQVEKHIRWHPKELVDRMQAEGMYAGCPNKYGVVRGLDGNIKGYSYSLRDLIANICFLYSSK